MTHDKTMDKNQAARHLPRQGRNFECVSPVPQSPASFLTKLEACSMTAGVPQKSWKKNIGWRYQPRKTWKNHEKSCNIPNLVEDMHDICKHCLKPPAKSSYIIKSNLLARGHLKQHSFGESNGNSKVQPSSLQTIQMNPNDQMVVYQSYCPGKYLKLVPVSEHLEAMLPSTLRHKTLPR